MFSAIMSLVSLTYVLVFLCTLCQDPHDSENVGTLIIIFVTKYLLFNYTFYLVTLHGQDKTRKM